MILNAKIESLQEKPAYRDAASNCCLVLATGYYEWQWLDAKDKSKQKYFIQPKEQEVFAFAEIYSSWKNPKDGNLVNFYSIVTTEANELMSSIHNKKKRMHVVLRQVDRKSWLSRAGIENFAFPYEVELEARDVFLGFRSNRFSSSFFGETT